MTAWQKILMITSPDSISLYCTFTDEIQTNKTNPLCQLKRTTL